jgi:predicted phage terminase large subunit-like protein
VPFNIVDAAPEDVRMVRAWDLADIVRFRASPAEVRERVRRVAEADGNNVRILIEEEPGSAGKALVDEYKRQILDGYAVYSVRPTGSKELRADPLAAKADAGYLHLVEGAWNAAFLDEIVIFPDGRHDDQVDAVAYACDYLAQRADDDVPIGSPIFNPRPSPWNFDHPDAYKRPRTQTIITLPEDWDW